MKIKFRFWDKKIQEMNHLDLHELTDGEIWFDGETDTWSAIHDATHEQGRFIAMQYTGLKDKNGVEIYEGDIIEVSNDLFVVKYSESYVAFRLDRIDIPTNVAMVKAHSKYYKVVGNIYRDKELLND